MGKRVPDNPPDRETVQKAMRKIFRATSEVKEEPGLAPSPERNEQTPVTTFEQPTGNAVEHTPLESDDEPLAMLIVRNAAKEEPEV